MITDNFSFRTSSYTYPRRPEVAGIEAAQGQVLIQEEDESVNNALE